MTQHLRHSAPLVATLGLLDEQRGIGHRNSGRGETSLAARAVAAVGLLSAALFFCHGVLRMVAQPVLSIDGLDPEWGEAAYVTVQIVGTHLLAQGAVLALCAWIVGTSALWLPTRGLPIALGILGLTAAFRPLGGLVGGLAQGDVPALLWVAGIVAIPLAFLWCMAAGVTLTARSIASRRGSPARPAA